MSAEIEPRRPGTQLAGDNNGRDNNGAARALELPRLAVESRLRRDGFNRTDFQSVRMDDAPGRNDWVVGNVARRWTARLQTTSTSPALWTCAKATFARSTSIGVNYTRGALIGDRRLACAGYFRPGATSVCRSSRCRGLKAFFDHLNEASNSTPTKYPISR